MARKGKKASKTGLPPGSLVYTGYFHDEKSTLELISYDADNCSRRFIEIAEIATLFREKINWIKVTGLSDVQTIEQIGTLLDLDSLLLEDILNANLRPTIAQHGKALFVSFKALHKVDDDHEFRQLSFVLTQNLLLSFSEEEHQIFRIIEDRLEQPAVRIRRKNLDYLLHAFIDMTVDHYLEHLEMLMETIEMYDEKILHNPNERLLLQIQQIRKHLIKVDKFVFPMRDIVNQLINLDDEVIENRSQQYFRDVYDHLIFLIENIKGSIEQTASLKDFYVSRASLNMNKVIQLLTLVSITFIPLTFIAGVYGMNFDNMPELHWKYGYFIILGAMLFIFVGLLLYFRRKKWL